MNDTPVRPYIAIQLVNKNEPYVFSLEEDEWTWFSDPASVWVEKEGTTIYYYKRHLLFVEVVR